MTVDMSDPIVSNHVARRNFATRTTDKCLSDQVSDQVSDRVMKWSAHVSGRCVESTTWPTRAEPIVRSLS
jgi:hypothetical protein